MIVSSEKRAAFLCDLARQDEAFAPLISALEQSGFVMDFRLFGPVGGYIPAALEFDNMPPASDQISKLCHKPKFVLSMRHGRDIMVHTWLHELIHYNQDRQGLLYIPSISAGEILSQQSYIDLYLFCEAQAAVKAITASYSLYKKGITPPWKGALKSLNWRAMAKQYVGHGEEELYEFWYQSAQKAYYKKKFAKHWLRLKRQIESQNHTGKPIKTLEVSIEEYKNSKPLKNASVVFQTV